MKKRFVYVVAGCISLFYPKMSPALFAQEPVSRPAEAKQIDRRSDWDSVEVVDNQRTLVRKLDVSPKASPQPALRYRFVDEESDMKDWNAAIFYLRAIGFIDQEHLRKARSDYVWKAIKDVEGQKKQPQPHAWLNYRPHELPLEEVKKYLKFTEFQVADLIQAQKCRTMNFERHIREIESPATLQIPEIDRLRELMRDQRLRFRVALAENRVADGMEILRQQFAMSRHLSQDSTLIASLVSTVVSDYALDDCIFLIQRSDSPNTYWALTTLPDPMQSMRPGLESERRFMQEQNSLLKQVDLSPIDDEFCTSAINQIAKTIVDLEVEGWSKETEVVRNRLNEMISHSHLKAQAYLENEIKIPREQLNGLLPKHIVLLAMVKYFDRRADDIVKWSFVPYWQIAQNPAYIEFVASESNGVEPIGEITTICNLFAPKSAILTAPVSPARNLALLRNIEAIRMYAADHDGKPPASLKDTPVPSPEDPVTGQNFRYVAGEHSFELAVPPLGNNPAMRFDVTIKPIAEATEKDSPKP